MQGVEFQGFAGDCTISGQVTMFGDRLTDFLNGQERFRLHHVECTSLEDGRIVPVDSISVERDDLLAVVGTGPRGSEEQRIEVSETARRRFGYAGPKIGTGAELLAYFNGLRAQGVERVYVWFCDFAQPESLAGFGETVIARMQQQKGVRPQV